MEDIVRKPRKFPPSDIKGDDVVKATKNGVVDLSKIRKAKEKRKEERIKKAAKMLRARKWFASIIGTFQDSYKKYFGGKYNLRPERFVTRHINKNTAKRYKIQSDNARIRKLYNYIKTRYDGGGEEYKQYLDHIFDELTEIEISNRQIIGYIEKEERIDKFFAKLSKERKRSGKARDVRRRAKVHSQYFDDE